MLATLAAFSISLAVRPLGGVFFGNLADKVGRRYVPYMTMLGAGLSSFLMGFLPTYAQAGLILTVLSASDAIGSIFGGVLVDWFRSSARALLATALIIIALIYPTMYAILILGNGWLVLLWDFIAVLPVGVLQVYIRTYYHQASEPQAPA